MASVQQLDIGSFFGFFKQMKDWKRALWRFKQILIFLSLGNSK